MEFFELLGRSLGIGERLRLEITREGDTVTLLVHPLLNAAPSNLDETQQQLRAALAHPLWLRGAPEQIDRELIPALLAYTHTREALHATASELDALDEALRRTQQAVQTKRQKVAKTSGRPASTDDADDVDATEDDPATAAAPVASPPAITTHPDSLF